MTEEQIRESNIAIAKFLQFGNVGTKKIIYAVTLDGKAVGYFRPENLEFHTSWDWLMPVIQKLYKIDLIWTQYEDTIRAALPYEGIEDIHAKVYKWILAVEKFNEGLS